MTVLPGSFYLTRQGLDYAEWSNPLPSFIRPRYDMKILIWTIDSLVQDRTIFRGIHDDALIIMHVNSQYYEGSGIQYDARHAAMYSYRDSIHLTKQGADSLLRQWGLSRYISE